MLPDHGVSSDGRTGPTGALDADAVPASAPEAFRTAVSSLLTTRVRREARVERIRPPQRLAPWSFAVAVDISTTAHPDCATGCFLFLPCNLVEKEGAIHVPDRTMRKINEL